MNSLQFSSFEVFETIVFGIIGFGFVSLALLGTGELLLQRLVRDRSDKLPEILLLGALAWSQAVFLAAWGGIWQPAIGVALQSFSDSAGSARLADADVQLHVGPLVKRLGFSLGYTYRVKRWNVGGSSVFVTRSPDLFDYHEQRHTFSLGVNW